MSKVDSVIGVEQLHYAICTKDDSTGTTYSAPVLLPGVQEIGYDPKSDTAKHYGDNKVLGQTNKLSAVQLKIKLADLDLPTRATLLGHKFVDGSLVKNESDIAPDVAIGFATPKKNGGFRYKWLYKGQFSLPTASVKGIQDKVEYQSQEISGDFVPRISDGNYEREADDSNPETSAACATWFDAVDPNVDETPLTVATTIPANNATNINVAAKPVWAFSKPLMPSAVSSENFIVMKADGSAQVAGTIAVNAAGDQVTFTPSANLTAATQYMLIVTTAVEDLYGNALAAPNISKFTTA